MPPLMAEESSAWKCLNMPITLSIESTLNVIVSLLRKGGNKGKK
jgi:hypothetical protein